MWELLLCNNVQNLFFCKLVHKNFIWVNKLLQFFYSTAVVLIDLHCLLLKIRYYTFMCPHLRSHSRGQVCFIAKFCNFCLKLSHWFVFSCVISSVYQLYSVYFSLLYLVAGEILLNRREIEITVIKKFRGFLHCRLFCRTSGL